MIPRWDMRTAIKNRRLHGYRFNRAACFSYSNHLRWAWFQTRRNSINASLRMWVAQLTSQTRTVPSSETVTTRLPSG
jgi:hypothetical protein